MTKKVCASSVRVQVCAEKKDLNCRNNKKIIFWTYGANPDVTSIFLHNFKRLTPFECLIKGVHFVCTLFFSKTTSIICAALRILHTDQCATHYSILKKNFVASHLGGIMKIDST